MSHEAGTASSPVAIGEVLAGKYRIDRVLGQGGMGIVVAATHVHLRQKVAIKFLLKGARGDVVARFLREARSAARLKSEHVARVLDVGELPTGSPYMVMEYLEGSDLEGVLAQRGPLPIEEAVLHVLQACEAIAEAHAAGIVHRDLKPANLFLTRTPDGSGSVKVLDFGISKDTTEDGGDESASLTRTTAVLGSPSYMAPEQMRSTRDADARADIWSLGVILYELLTGAVPFNAESFVELALKVISDEPPPPTNFRADLPPGLEAAILRCIRKEPSERFASVTELASAIAPFGSPVAATYAERISRVQGVPTPTSASMVPVLPMVEGGMAATHARGSEPSAEGAKTVKAGTLSAGWAGGAPPKPRSRTGLVVASAAVGVAVLVGGAAFALRGSEPASQPPPTTQASPRTTQAEPSPQAEPEPKAAAPVASAQAPAAAEKEAAGKEEEPSKAEETAEASETTAPPDAGTPTRRPAAATPARAPAKTPSKAATKATATPKTTTKPTPAEKAPQPRRNPLDMDIQ